MIRLARWSLLPLAVLVTAGALVWWWWTFGAMVGYGYLTWPDAGRCIVSDNDICALARTLCIQSHPRLILAYWTVSFWAGFALLSISLFLGPTRRASA